MHTPTPLALRAIPNNYKLRAPESEIYITSGPSDCPGNRVVAAVFPVDGNSAAELGGLIVRAVNSHAAIVAALTPFAELLEEPGDYTDEFFEATVSVADIRTAVAALAKAKA